MTEELHDVSGATQRLGVAVPVYGDRAIGFPPLNMNLAHELVRRTRV